MSKVIEQKSTYSLRIICIKPGEKLARTSHLLILCILRFRFRNIHKSRKVIITLDKLKKKFHRPPHYNAHNYDTILNYSLSHNLGND